MKSLIPFPLIIFCLTIAMARGEVVVPHLVEGESVLASAEVAGKLFDWDPKVEDRALLLCRDELCIPIWLDNVKHRRNDDGMFVDADALGNAMGFRSELNDGKLTLYPLDSTAVTRADRPAYHAKWPEGRGFEVGQTLPDIPLMDLDGKEVRFSNFLGKQYVIYGWASW